jgi:hypothetical protein
MRTKFLTRTLLVAIRVVMAVGAILVVSLPWTAGWLMEIFADGHSDDHAYTVFITAFYMIVGVLVIWGLGEAQSMVSSIVSQPAATALRALAGTSKTGTPAGSAAADAATVSGPFTQRNARSLMRAGWLSVATAAMFLFRTILYPDATAVLVAVAAVLVGLACFTLSQLVAQAAALKAENDLTI